MEDARQLDRRALARPQGAPEETVSEGEFEIGRGHGVAREIQAIGGTRAALASLQRGCFAAVSRAPATRSRA